MCKSVSRVCIGVDVGKYELAVARDDATTSLLIANDLPALEGWITGLPPACSVVMEATGRYHQQLAKLLHCAGHRVYVVNGLKLSQYRKSVGQRAKSDPSDAKLLLRYLQHEQAALRVWQPVAENIHNIRTLLRRRSELIKAKVALRQSLSDIPEIDSKEAVSSIESTLIKLDHLIAALLEKGDVAKDASRCQQITGIGPLTSAALTATFHSGTFTRVDAFIAFIGLDLVANDSGRKTGRRRLSKQGDHETRRLLHNAAMSACRVGQWKVYYESYLDRGLARTQALVIVARKIARIAFSLLKTGANYDEELAFITAK